MGDILNQGIRAVVHELFIDFMIAYDSIRWEALYKILLEFVRPTKPGR
jgi:hypothetical protein